VDINQQQIVKEVFAYNKKKSLELLLWTYKDRSL